MGCSASRLDTEQCVTRCRDRKHFIKLAVQHRHAFAAAHAAYIQSLKNTGAAIRQFGEGEAKDSQIAEMIPSNTPNLLYLPPPLPHFLTSPTPSTPSNLGRASSMPPIRTLPAASRSPSLTPPATQAVKEEDEEEVEEERHTPASGTSSQKGAYGGAEAKPPPPLPLEPHAPPPPPPPTGSAWEIFNVFPPSENGDLDAKNEGLKQDEQHVRAEEGTPITKGREEQVEDSAVLDTSADFETPQKEKPLGAGKNSILALRELDDQFLAAFESGKEVARLLEARKTHYHSNFAKKGDWDHSSRVLRVMSWGRHPNMPLGHGEPFDIFYGGEKETHASTLDKLLAWEKKLHDEVKAGEVIRIELERKSVQLRNQKRREEESTAVNKTKAIVKSLQTRYLVEIQAVDAASIEVEKLRDDCLHTQMVALVQELMTMWKAMVSCHKYQHQMIEDMESLDSLYASTTTTEFHHKNTVQLETEVNLWNHNFDRLIVTQKEYLNAVYRWLRLHIIQIESDGKDAPGSPQKMSTPPVFKLCREWVNALDQLPHNMPLHALKAFSGILHELTMQQMEELKQKRRLDSAKKEVERKEQALKAQEMRYSERHTVHDDEKEGVAAQDGNPIKERESMVKVLKEKVEAETERYERLCLKSRTMTVSSLHTGLPPVLNAVKEFARVCSQCYTDLYTLTLIDGMPKLQISY